MKEGFTVEGPFHVRLGQHGRKQLRRGKAPARLPAGRIPRVSRLMALAIRFDELIHSSAVADQAELARLGHVTRARLTQIMNLLHLATDIQEQILFLPLIKRGHAPITERQLRPIAAVLDWRRQRRMWAKLIRQVKPPAGAALSGVGDTSTARR